MPFQIGQVVWAKLSGFPWWPAQIESPDDVSEQVLASKPDSPDNVVCRFFGPKPTYGWLIPDKTSMLDFQKHFASKKAKKPSKALLVAIDEARQELTNQGVVFAPLHDGNSGFTAAEIPVSKRGRKRHTSVSSNSHGTSASTASTSRTAVAAAAGTGTPDTTKSGAVRTSSTRGRKRRSSAQAAQSSAAPSSSSAIAAAAAAAAAAVRHGRRRQPWRDSSAPATGAVFAHRSELWSARVHARAVGVVCGNDVSGVESIILGESSKPLRVIKDTGDTLHVSICADQPEQTALRNAFRVTCTQHKPVQVVRASGLDSPHAPPYGYRVDGLYTALSFDADTVTLQKRRKLV